MAKGGRRSTALGIVAAACVIAAACGGSGVTSTSTPGVGGSAGSHAGGSIGGSTAADGGHDSGGARGEDCPAGTETCPCYGNDTCNAGLTCASGLCVDLGTGGAPGAGGSAAGGAIGSGGGPTGGAPGAGGSESGGAPGSGGTTTGTGGAEGTCAQIGGLEDCAFETDQAETSQVNVLLVMDKSASMDETPAGYTTTKWAALHTALSTALTEVQGVASFGLELFPTTASIGNPIPFECGDSGRCCEMPTTSEMNVDIGPGTTTVPQIIDALAQNQPAGGTPAAYALSRAYDYFTSGAGAELRGNRFVLLATDGAPNCNNEVTCDVSTCTLNLENKPGCPPAGASCCASNREGCVDDSTTVQQIRNLLAVGVATIVVGIPGSELYAANLQDFADAGGFTRPDGDFGYYEVSAEGGVEALTQTFTEITTSLVTQCEIPITREIPNLNEVNVAVNCEVIPKGDEAGNENRWFFDNPDWPSRILIQGPICDTIQTQGVDRVDVVFGCPSVGL